MRDYEERLRNIEKTVNSRAIVVAVSKYSHLEQIKGFYKAGHKHFGENRVETLLEKNSILQEEGHELPYWHYIGKIQSNKINKLFSLPTLEYLHSVDSLSILKKLIKKSERIVNPRGINYFLQVNISGESQKSGFYDFEQLKEAYRLALTMEDKKFNIIGLMAMGRIRTDDFSLDAHKSFCTMVEYKNRLQNELREELGPREVNLSMGMSKDYELALDQGADFVRIGRCLFFDEKV